MNNVIFAKRETVFLHNISAYDHFVIYWVIFCIINNNFFNIHKKNNEKHYIV